jgi:hypothetical protein
MPFGLPDEVGVPVGRSRRGSARLFQNQLVTRKGAMGTGSHLTPPRARKFPVNLTCEAVRQASVEESEIP